MTACLSFHLTTPQCPHTPHLSLQPLTVLVRALLFLLFDHVWRINGPLHMLSGPCGGTTPGNLSDSTIHRKIRRIEKKGKRCTQRRQSATQNEVEIPLDGKELSRTWAEHST